MMGIYSISLNGSVVYIGQSRNIDRRIYNHRHYMQSNDTRHENRYLCNACQKYGIDAFDFAVIEEVDSPEKLTEREKYWIRFYDFPKGNYAIPNDDDDWTVSNDFIANYLTGENNPNYGNYWSDEQKQKASRRFANKYAGENNPNYGNIEGSNPITKHLCPYKTTEELESALYEYKGFVGLSRHLGVSAQSVQTWCEHRKIPYKKRDYVDGFGIPELTITKSEFIESYFRLGRKGFLKHYGLTRAGYYKWREKLGISGRMERPRPLPDDELIAEYEAIGICEMVKKYHTSFYKVKKWIDEAGGGDKGVGKANC